ncbi:MAG: PAS domain S-box protein [Proteobacteria bacterium]|nr:PAS domain S-box protein [Pseudomonadota bacterium]
MSKTARASEELIAETAIARLVAIVEASEDSITSETLDGIVTSWSEGATRIFGYMPDEMIGQPITRIIPMELHAEEANILARIGHGERVAHYETLRITKDGRRIDVLLQVSPLRDKSGNVFGTSTIARDTTERKAADDALNAGEARLRHALEASGAGVWTWDGDTGLITVDEVYRAMYGIAPDVTVDFKIWEARLHPDDRETLKQRAEECLHSGSQWREEFRILHPQLGTRWLAGLGRVVRDPNGRVTGMTGINIDITAQKTAESAVAEREAHLMAVVEGAIDGIITFGDDGTVLSLNTAAATMFGAAPNDVIGQNVRMLMPHLSAQNDFLPKGSSTTEAKTTGIIREVVGRHWDGSTFPLDLGITEVSREGQRLVIAIVRDITERKQTEETQRLLIDELNHRVKNTLATVQAMAEQTLQNTRDPTHFVESFRGRLQALSRAHNLLTQKTWTGVDLESLIREQLLVSGSQILTCTGPKIELKPRVAVHLGLALHELGTNARKYGALKVPEGRLSVTWHLADHGADPELELTWVESGGPAVSQPTDHGFGTLLIERGLKHSLGGEAHMKFMPTGVICKMRVPHWRSQ